MQSHHSPRRRLTLGVTSALVTSVALALVMMVVAGPAQAAQASSASVAVPSTAAAPLTPEESAELSGFDPIGAAQCVAAVGAFVAGNALVVLKVRRAGGVIRAAKKLLEANSAERRLKAALTIFGDISGVIGVVEACG